MLATTASNTEISLMTVATLLQVKHRPKVGTRSQAHCCYFPKLIETLLSIPSAPPLQLQVFVVPLGACFFLLNEPLLLVSLPQGHPLHWSLWELKFPSDNFTALFKHCQRLPTTHSTEPKTNSFYMQGHKGTFSPSPWEISGSLNTCCIFWSPCRGSHCYPGI